MHTSSSSLFLNFNTLKSPIFLCLSEINIKMFFQEIRDSVKLLEQTARELFAIAQKSHQLATEDGKAYWWFIQPYSNSYLHFSRVARIAMLWSMLWLGNFVSLWNFCLFSFQYHPWRLYVNGKLWSFSNANSTCCEPAEGPFISFSNQVYRLWGDQFTTHNIL